RKHIPGAAPATHAAELPEPTQRRELASSLLAGDLALVRELPGGHRPAPGHDRAPPAGESPRAGGALLVHLARPPPPLMECVTSIAHEGQLEIAWLEPAVALKDHRLRERRLQLAHVARPGVAQQDLERLRGHSSNREAIPCVRLTADVLPQHCDVVVSLA